MAAATANITPTGFNPPSQILETTTNPPSTIAMANQSLGRTFSLNNHSDTSGTITIAVYSINKAIPTGKLATAFEYDHCMRATPKIPNKMRFFHSFGFTLKALGFVRASAIPAPSAVANDLKITSSSGEIPAAMVTLEVEALSPNRTTPARAKITPSTGRLVLN